MTECEIPGAKSCAIKELADQMYQFRNEASVSINPDEASHLESEAERMQLQINHFACNVCPHKESSV